MKNPTHQHPIHDIRLGIVNFARYQREQITWFCICPTAFIQKQLTLYPVTTKVEIHLNQPKIKHLHNYQLPKQHINCSQTNLQTTMRTLDPNHWTHCTSKRCWMAPSPLWQKRYGSNSCGYGYDQTGSFRTCKGHFFSRWFDGWNFHGLNPLKKITKQI